MKPLNFDRQMEMIYALLWDICFLNNCGRVYKTHYKEIVQVDL